MALSPVVLLLSCGVGVALVVGLVWVLFVRSRLSRCADMFAGIQGRIGFTVPMIGSCSGFLTTKADISAVRLDFDLADAGTFMDPVRAFSQDEDAVEERTRIGEWLSSKGCEAILSVLLRRHWHGGLSSYCWITLPTGAEYALHEIEELEESEGTAMKSLTIVANRVLNHAASLNLLEEMRHANTSKLVPSSKEEERFRRLRKQHGGSIHFFSRVGKENEPYSYGLHFFTTSTAPVAMLKIMENDEHGLMQELLVTYHSCDKVAIDQALFLPPKNVEPQNLA